MKVSAEHVPDSRVVLEIEVDPERVERSLDQAYRRIATRTRIPGFRPGKAPRHMVERAVGHERLMQEALDKLMPEVYREAVEESAIDPIAVPEFEVTSFDPVTIKATVPVRPTVDLGDYRSIRVERRPVTVTVERIQAEVDLWRRRLGTWEPVERGVEKGDLVSGDLEMVVDGKPLVKQEDAEFLARDELERSLPGLLEGILGAAGGETRQFTATLPQDFRESTVAGLEAGYTITVKEIKTLQLPEPDDEFARSVGENLQSFAEFREWVAEGLRREAEGEEERRLQEEALEELVRGATLEYPAVLVEHEVDHLLREQVGARRDERALERYLQRVGRSESEMRDELWPPAEERVRRSLVLFDLAKAEEITADDAEIEAELNEIARGSEELRKALDKETYREQLRRTLTNRKTLARLAELAAVPAAASETGDAARSAQTPAGKKAPARRRAAKRETQTKEMGG